MRQEKESSVQICRKIKTYVNRYAPEANNSLEEYRRWTLPETGVDSYQDVFRGVLRGKTFIEIINKRKEEGKKTLAIDLMGYGKVLRELSQDAGLAVAFADPRTGYRKQKDKAEKNLSLITGDVLLPSTWNKISGWLNKQDVLDKKANLILCRPNLGLIYLPSDINVTFYLLRKMWGVLSSDNGMLFTEVRWTDWKIADEWSRIFNAQHANNTECRFSISENPSLLLVKTSNSPDKLPTFSQLKNK